MRAYILPAGRARTIVSQRCSRPCPFSPPRARFSVNAIAATEDTSVNLDSKEKDTQKVAKKEYVKRMVAVHVGYIGSNYYGESLKQNLEHIPVL
jgi:hypothetical protein